MRTDLRAPGGEHRPGRPRRWGIALLAVALLVGPIAVVTVAAAAPVRAATPNPNNDYVNVTATGTLSFVPSSFSVFPGATVHLRVTQGANFLHTFTLSSVANTSVPSIGWFSTHPPLVNLSLGTTAGNVSVATFVAPAVGTYEFVCEKHYPSMKGSMTSTSASPAPPPPSSGGAGALSPIEQVIVAAAVFVVVAGLGIWWWYGRHDRVEERVLGSRRRR